MIHEMKQQAASAGHTAVDRFEQARERQRDNHFGLMPDGLRKAYEEQCRTNLENLRSNLARLGYPKPPISVKQVNVELPAYWNRARELKMKIPSFFLERDDGLPDFKTRPFKPRTVRKIQAARISLSHTPEQVQAERQRIQDRASARLEALGPCPDLAGLGRSFPADSDVMTAATRYVDVWIEKHDEVEHVRRARLSDDETEKTEQQAFENGLARLKQLKKDFDDAQQRVIDDVINSRHAF